MYLIWRMDTTAKGAKKNTIYSISVKQGEGGVEIVYNVGSKSRYL